MIEAYVMEGNQTIRFYSFLRVVRDFKQTMVHLYFGLKNPVMRPKSVHHFHHNEKVDDFKLNVGDNQ